MRLSLDWFRHGFTTLILWNLVVDWLLVHLGNAQWLSRGEAKNGVKNGEISKKPETLVSKSEKML